MACAYDGLSTINICDGAGISARTSLDERLTLSYPPALARKPWNLGWGRIMDKVQRAQMTVPRSHRPRCALPDATPYGLRDTIEDMIRVCVGGRYVGANLGVGYVWYVSNSACFALPATSAQKTQTGTRPGISAMCPACHGDFLILHHHVGSIRQKSLRTAQIGVIGLCS